MTEICIHFTFSYAVISTFIKLQTFYIQIQNDWKDCGIHGDDHHHQVRWERLPAVLTSSPQGVADQGDSVRVWQSGEHLSYVAGLKHWIGTNWGTELALTEALTDALN